MNIDKSLKRVSIAAMALIVILMININYVQGTQATALQKNKLNARQYQDIFARPRGKIYAGGQVLAYSKPVGTSGKNQKYQRWYNNGNAFFPVTGYFASTGLTSGIESAYNGLLSGTDKRESVQSWFDAFVGKKPLGADVYTTIDPKAQALAYQAIGNAAKRRSAVVFVELKTGAIKVAASYPSFDPNTISSDQDGTKANAAFTAQQKLGVTRQGDINKAFNETFPPGSSFKSVVAAAMLQNGSTESSPVDTPASATVPGSTHSVLSDCSVNGTPALIDSFAQSCNTTFALYGQHNTSLVNDQATKLGFFKPIQIEPGLNSASSFFPAAAGPANVFLGSFGQGETRATPLQMAMVAAAIGNGGTMMKPYLVQNVKAQDGSDLYTANPAPLGQPISSSTASQLQDMMKAVVSRGTAASVLGGQDIAGKTGTAESGTSLRTLWFVGFAPASAPKYAFALMVEGVQGGFGATVAGPPAAQIAAKLIADNK